MEDIKNDLDLTQDFKYISNNQNLTINFIKNDIEFLQIKYDIRYYKI